MAWMFAGTANDMSVGMHQHIHLPWGVFAPPTPFYPHPAVGFIRDKLATKTNVDGRKAARTGSKFKILITPHLPWIGPLTHGTGKEGTGIQLGFMGAGIGAHPFGGIGFVTIEGKPAIGMLSPLLGCWCVAPGFDMMLPFVGLDFLMIPTRGPSVFYGPAPLAIDLFVLLIANLECVLDYLISKIPIPWLQELATIGKDALIAGCETAATAYESGVRPISACLKAGARAMAYTAVEGLVNFAVDKVCGGIGDLAGRAGDGLLGQAVGKGADWLTGEIRGRVLDGEDGSPGLATQLMDRWTDGDYSAYREERDARNAAMRADPSPFFDTLDSVMSRGGELANTAANNAYSQHQAAYEEQHGRPFDPNDPSHPPLTPEQRSAALSEGRRVAGDSFRQAGREYWDSEGGPRSQLQGAVRDTLPGPLGDYAADLVPGGDRLMPGPDVSSDEYASGSNERMGQRMRDAGGNRGSSSGGNERSGAGGSEPSGGNPPEAHGANEQQGGGSQPDAHGNQPQGGGQPDAHGNQPQGGGQPDAHGNQPSGTSQGGSQPETHEQRREQTRQNLQQGAERDQASSQQAREWSENNQRRAEESERRSQQLREQAANEQDPDRRRELNRQANFEQDSAQANRAAAERQRMEADAFDRRSRERERLANDPGYVDARAAGHDGGEGAGGFEPIGNNMSPEDRQRRSELMDQESATARRGSSWENYDDPPPSGTSSRPSSSSTPSTPGSSSTPSSSSSTPHADSTPSSSSSSSSSGSTPSSSGQGSSSSQSSSSSQPRDYTQEREQHTSDVRQRNQAVEADRERDHQAAEARGASPEDHQRINEAHDARVQENQQQYERRMDSTTAAEEGRQPSAYTERRERHTENLRSDNQRVESERERAHQEAEARGASPDEHQRINQQYDDRIQSNQADYDARMDDVNRQEEEGL